MRLATWHRSAPKDLLAEAVILLGRVCGRLHVQDLVHLGQEDLMKVEEA